MEDSSGSKANVALIKNLHKAGFELLVYHYTRKNISINGVNCVSIPENRRSLLFFLSRAERYARYAFKWELNKYVESLFGFSFTLFNDRNSIVTALRKLDFDPDLVLTLSKGGSFRPHHALLKIPEWHSKWMAYVHDPYPFSCYPRPYDWVEPGHQKKRDFFLKISQKARYVGYPSQLLAEWMESYYPPLKGKAVIIPHQINSEDFEEEKELPAFFKNEAFSIVHAGTLLSARNPLGLIRAFRRFLDEHPEAKEHSQILFLGDRSVYSEEFEEIQKQTPQFFATNNYVPFATVLTIQKNASVNVILEAKGPISPFLPGKFPHCIAANKPILLLGPFYSESKRLLGDEYLYWAEIDKIDKIAEHIENLYQQWKINSAQLGISKPDLREYLSVNFLKTTIASIIHK